MRHHSVWLLLVVLLASMLSVTGAYASAVVVYLDDYGAPKAVIHPGVSDVTEALQALSTPIKDPATGKLLKSAILPETKLLSFKLDGGTSIVNFSKDILANGEIDENRLTTVFYQVKGTLRQYNLDKQIKLLADGNLLSDYTPPIPFVGPSTQALAEANTTQISTTSLSGRKITVSPGHGWFWNGTGWHTQRPVYCAPLNEEDFHNLEMCQYLQTYLEADGATVKMVRCTDKNYGNSPWPGAHPWWQMAATYWLQHVGYPCSVYGPYGCNLGEGGSDSSNDITSRPLSSNYDASDIYVSLHTNGASGDCYGGCPSGTETYYDNSSSHAAYGAVSQNLATKINNNIMAAINGNYDAGWQCHGACVKDSAGAFGEIRVPSRAATLTELAFHDSCTIDAAYLRDNFFRSTAMWGMYAGICQYFGTTPVWGFYSCELVSDTFPAVMETGHPYTVSLTFRNRGVLWTEAKAIRLGAVGEQDPFTPATRQTISGEIGPGQTYTFTFNIVAPNAGGTYTTDWRMVRDGYTWFGPTFSKTYEIIGPPDGEPPTVPANVFAEGVSLNQVDISWSPSTDNVGVIGYRVYRNGVQIADIQGTSYSDSGRAANTQYSYTVSAYDAVNNESAQSAPSVTVTHAVVWQDGLPDLSGWPADKVANGTYRGLEEYFWDNHGTYPGDVCAATLVGTTSTQGSYAYKNLSQTFSAGSFDCYFADQALYTSKQGIHVRGFNGSTQVFSAFLGCYPDAPVSPTKYAAGVYDGSSWSWASQSLTRTIGWLNLRVEVGATAIRFYINGTPRGTLPKPANATTYGISRVNIGHEYNVGTEGYFDDMQFTAPPPASPAPGAATALSTSSIRWNFADRSPVETAYMLHDASHVQKGTGAKNSVYIDESGLTANTQYTRHIHGKNGSVEGPASTTMSRYTLSVAPTTSNVTCDRTIGTEYGTPEFVFTAVGGFGTGKVAYYAYTWEKASSHTWTGAEPQWNSGTLTLHAISSGNWYLHVKGFNGDGVENGTLVLGPYDYNEPTGTIAEAKTQADDTAVEIGRTVVTANFGTFFYIEEADGSAGIRIDAGSPDEGTLVTISGTIDTVDNERRIVNPTVSTFGTASVTPEARLVKNLDLGGGSLNACTPGILDGIGANNIGQLLLVAGKVTYVGTGFCYIDDGSMVTQDGSGFTGIRVDTTEITAPGIDTYAVIKGISSTYPIGSNYVRMLRATEKVDYPIP